MESISIDLAPYVRAVWKRKWFILVLVFLAAGISLGLSLREPRVYQSTALIKIGRIWNEPIEDPYVLAEIINSQPFLTRVGEKLTRKRRPEALSRALSAERLEGGKARNRYVYLIRLTARGGAPEEAKELARAASDQTGCWKYWQHAIARPPRQRSRRMACISSAPCTMPTGACRRRRLRMIGCHDCSCTPTHTNQDLRPHA